MKLLPHPRLHIGARELARLARPPATPLLAAADRWVARHAARWAGMPPLTFDPTAHNAFLIRARHLQARVLTLLVRWRQTDDSRCRAAAIACIRMLGAWECWSWIAWRARDYRPEAIFDLSYGENAATLAMAYDLLHDTLSADERQEFREIALRWPLAAGAVHCRPGAAWWFGRADSNWNAVCGGGLGMLCLAMHDELARAREILPRVERSLIPFMRQLDRTSGGWPEGLGYWNYGMRYAFMYLLSWENATGRSHPLLRLDGTRRTLEFPLDFCPNGQACGFGDSNSWAPLPEHYAVARRLRARVALQGLEARLAHDRQTAMNGRWTPKGDWGAAAGWLLFHDGRPTAGHRRSGRGAKIYRGLDWALLADRWPAPRLFMAVRGGTTKVPHGHRDLFSFNLVVNDEKLIANQGNAEYLDTTFSSRRCELPDINPQYKNTILLNGLGVSADAALDATEIRNRPGLSGVRLTGASSMGTTRDNGPAALFCGRLVLLLQGQAFLIVDRVVTPFPARVEARLHTYARVARAPRGALLRGRRESLRLAFAASVPGLLASATTAPTTPTAPPARMLRWCTRGLHTRMTLVTLAVPGSAPAQVSVAEQGTATTIAIRTRPVKLSLVVSEKLTVRRMEAGG